MKADTYRRSTSAVCSADVAGYSGLMENDDKATVGTLSAYRRAMGGLIGRHRGLVASPGNNLPAGFASVVDALRCAREVQRDLARRNALLPEHRKMLFRIGINPGDVIAEGTRPYGNGVNAAARLRPGETQGVLPLRIHRRTAGQEPSESRAATRSRRISAAGTSGAPSTFPWSRPGGGAGVRKAPSMPFWAVTGNGPSSSTERV
jgi:class 3 adenylate cyclase